MYTIKTLRIDLTLVRHVLRHLSNNSIALAMMNAELILHAGLRRKAIQACAERCSRQLEDELLQEKIVEVAA